MSIFTYNLKQTNNIMTFFLPNCDRCDKETNSMIGSMFNLQMICSDCKTKESKHEMYDIAVSVESDQVKGGNYNYEGIGLPEDLK
jgi:hypothetical protein